MLSRYLRLFSASLATIFLLVSTPAVSAQERPLTLRVVQSGHSLTDGLFDPLRNMIRASGVRQPVIDKSTMPGSPMDWRWEKADPNSGTDARYDIANYDLLVLTERVPVESTILYHDSHGQALHWFNHAWTNGNAGNGAETILYASWVNIESGPNYTSEYHDEEGHIPFRDRMPLEMARWESIRDHVNANRPAGSPEMKLIPGPLLMAAIYDEIEAGRAPGLTDISDLFLDGIHVNDLGAYYIALAHYAVIFGRDPRGLPHRTDIAPPQSVEQARWMQDLVWRVLSE